MVEESKQKKRQKKQHSWRKKTANEVILKTYRNGISVFTELDARQIIKVCKFKDIGPAYLCEILNRTILPMFLQKKFTLEHQPTLTDKKLVCRKIQKQAKELEKTLHISTQYADPVRWKSVELFLRSLSRLTTEVDIALLKLNSTKDKGGRCEGGRKKERNSVNKAAIFLIERLAYIYNQYSGVIPKIIYSEYDGGNGDNYNEGYKKTPFLNLILFCLEKITNGCALLNIKISDAFPKNRGAIAEMVKGAIHKIDFSKPD
jgi:hypothetical protein